MGALMMRLFSVRAGQCRDCSDKKFLINCNTCQPRGREATQRG